MNHRIFERKWRRRNGRHACLSVIFQPTLRPEAPAPRRAALRGPPRADSLPCAPLEILGVSEFCAVLVSRKGQNPCDSFVNMKGSFFFSSFLFARCLISPSPKPPRNRRVPPATCAGRRMGQEETLWCFFSYHADSLGARRRPRRARGAGHKPATTKKGIIEKKKNNKKRTPRHTIRDLRSDKTTR